MDASALDAVFEFVESMPPLKELIFEDVAFLKAILMDSPEVLDDCKLEIFESLARKIESVVSSFDFKKAKDNNVMGFELEMQLFILLLPIKDLKYEARLVLDRRQLKPSRFYNPKTSPRPFINHLVQNLWELMKWKADLIGPLEHFISQLHLRLKLCSGLSKILETRSWEDLVSLTSSSSSLLKIPELSKLEANPDGFIDHMTNLAYKVDFAINSYLVRDIPMCFCMLWLVDILNEFEQGYKDTSDSPRIGDDIVGFKAEMKTMRDLLIGYPERLCIISIVGMAGQGKTTLAKKLYNDLRKHFHICAWCCVSQVYQKRELLFELLSHVAPLSDTMHHDTDLELAARLKRHLMGRRFLIFLDDIWKIDAWNDLAMCFPNESNRSRIMFTTRIRELAFQARSDSILQPLCPVSEDESWELLRKKLFREETCPPELLDTGKQIAKICKGLPLSIVLTAGILSRTEKNENQWKQIANTVRSSIMAAEAEDIIELSYEHLPDDQKPCFLYFGAFLEDKEVQVRKLIQYWIAEGFIRQTDTMISLEDVAEHYFKELIDRSLVTVGQRKSNGRVKSCHVHDLLRDFCLSKAREENFLQLIRGYDNLFRHRLDPSDSYSSTPIVYHLCRICIYSKRDHFIKLEPSGPHVRSLLFFAADDMSPTCSYDISFISRNFKLLRILDLEGIHIGDSIKGIMVLVRLRYLAVQGRFDFIPSTIGGMKNLETFCAKRFDRKVVKVPDSIRRMTKLRHLHIDDCASFDLEPHRSKSFPILDNLQSFATPSLAYGDDNTEKILRRLPRIRKLKCIFLDSWDGATTCNEFPNLRFLYELVSLKVFYNGKKRYPCRFNLPQNLKELTLSKFHMPWDAISQLAMLPHLEVLKLLSDACDGKEWEVNEHDEFQNLKFLKLDTLNIVRWSASYQNFPKLEHIVLHKCKQLVEFPSKLEDIDTLQRIEVMWCTPDAATSAKDIQEELLDYGKKIYLHIQLEDYE